MRLFNCILVTFILQSASVLAYDWPIQEDTVQHVLTSVMGECREARDHFHRGIDISAPCSTRAYTIDGDTCYKDLVASPRGINIGPFRYYHNDTVDVVVRVYDPRVDTTGAGAGRGMGIYEIQYEILDILKNPIPGAINSYQFDSLPLNSATARYGLVYHDSTDWDNGIFYYWVTNAPFSDTANRYWNTKQHINWQWYEQPAESIEVAKFKDGYFYVEIKSWDICRPATNPCDSETVKVHVDNFNPKVKKTDPPNWFGFVPNRLHKVWCRFSEAMDVGQQSIRISEYQEHRVFKV